MIPADLLRAVGDGEGSQALITECGIIVRKYAPLQVHDWGKIEMHEKEKLWC